MFQKEVNYQFRQRYSVIHKPNRREETKCPTAAQVAITQAWSIVLPADADAVMTNAARDLEDYFCTSMNVCIPLVQEGKGTVSACRIVYDIDTTLPENSYRFAVDEKTVLLIGSNSRMAAQAGYYAEDLMNLCEAPFLDKQDAVRTSLFTPRMVHSGYGLDMFPTEHLVNLAHVGMSAILIFVNDIDVTPHGYQDFNDICYRANQYGLDVYAYSYLPNRRHPDDEDAEEYYEGLYGRLFDRCPYFKGLIFVGESCEFPSKDPHTCGVRRLDDFKDGNMQHPLLSYPGFYPCYDYPQWLELIQKIVYKRRPDADIVFWSYNWGHVSGEERKALIDKLPKGITLQATYEMHSKIERDGIENYTTDYTLFSPGPGNYFSTEGAYAKENGLRFYSMTNTGGLTWDIGVVPYLPAPYQWMKRYAGMREAHEKYGLCGTMESHHYGCAASFISELAKWAFYSPAVDMEEALRRIVARDFGEENVDAVCEVYRHFSDGIHYLISTTEDQYGANRIGPAYPFVLFDNQDIVLPSPSYAHFAGNEICFPLYDQDELGNDLGIGLNVENPDPKLVEKFDYEIDSFRKTVALYDQGCKQLEALLDRVPEKKREDATRVWALAAFIRNTVRTSINLKEFYKRKCRLLKTHGAERNQLIDEMIALCRAEEQNAVDTIPLVEFDSRLGYEPSMEYKCDRERIEWKLALLKKVMDTELPSYYEK